MAQTNQRALTVNAAFLLEIKEVHQDLWDLLDDLRARCSSITAVGSLGEMTERFDCLRDLLALHFSLEEAYGYFEDPIAVAPHLSEQSHQLRDEHIDLYVQSCQLAELAEQIRVHGQRNQRFAELASQFKRFDRQLQRHESAEMALINAAYFEDIGVGD